MANYNRMHVCKCGHLDIFHHLALQDLCAVSTDEGKCECSGFEKAPIQPESKVTG